MSNALTNVVQLDWADEDGIVTVTPQNENRFNIKLRKAIEILQLADKMDQFRQQFKLLLDVLGRWLKDRRDVARAFVTVRDGGLAFVLVRDSSEYDEAFEDAVSDLDYRLANDVDLDLIELDAIALPGASDEAIASFLDPRFTLSYVPYGGREGSHSAGE